MTGNYFVSFNDLLAHSAKPSLERVYNSKSAYDGWFGQGSGTVYETRIDVEKDGSLTMAEFGGGATASFFPSVIPSATLEEAVAKLVVAAKAVRDVTTPIDADDFRREAARNFRTRERKWKEYAARKLLDVADPANGQV